MRITYLVYEVVSREVLHEYESGYGKTSTASESINVLEPVHGIEPQDTREAAEAQLAMLDCSGEYIIITKYSKI